MNKKTVAIITARGGSKRIPKKNIKLFYGKPIIAYSIEAAKNAGIFDEIMVSTDDPEIKYIGESYGARVPFMRSEQTSEDYSTTADVLVEVLLKYRQQNIFFDYACCIYPTAPFITAKKLQDSFDTLKTNQAFSVIPVTKFSFPIWRSFKMENGKISYNWNKYSLTRSQDLPPAYHDCGQFYFFDVKKFLEEKKLVSENSFGIEISETEVQDIDTVEDWKVAEIKYSLLMNL